MKYPTRRYITEPERQMIFDRWFKGESQYSIARSLGRGLDEAVYVRCARKHVQKPGSPHRPTYACSGWMPPVPTAKRSVTHAKTRPKECHKTRELDINARLEKRT